MTAEKVLFFYFSGMSECSGPQLTNTMEAQQIGAIGKSFPGFHTLLKSVKDSEIIEEKGGGKKRTARIVEPSKILCEIFPLAFFCQVRSV